MFLGKQIHSIVLTTVLTIALSLGLVLSTQAAHAQSNPDLSAYVGRWKIDLANTRMGRWGPDGQNIVRDPNFTWVFTPDGNGLQMDVYTSYPQPAPTRTMTLIPDNVARPCMSATCLTTGGDPSIQTYAYWQMDRHLLARLFYKEDAVYEYSTYAISDDENTMTIVSWSPATPQWHNIQVFHRQE